MRDRIVLTTERSTFEQEAQVLLNIRKTKIKCSLINVGHCIVVIGHVYLLQFIAAGIFGILAGFDRTTCKVC